MMKRSTTFQRTSGTDKAPQVLLLPTVQQAHRAFLESLSISENKQTGLTTVSIEHQSPDVAQRWVELMVTRVSEDLRSKDIQEAEDSIEFLEKQREMTSLVALDEVFTTYRGETTTIMLAHVSKDYVFDVIDPPVAPDLKSRPSRSVVVVIGSLLGGILGLIIQAGRHFKPHKNV